jgi:hypothetical protein
VPEWNFFGIVAEMVDKGEITYNGLLSAATGVSFGFIIYQLKQSGTKTYEIH